jgi:hypothetical protein
MNGRSSTFGGVLGTTILIITGTVLVALLPDMYESVKGLLWWVFGK